jgi:GNAT superfamily N-acetyltransferase
MKLAALSPQEVANCLPQLMSAYRAMYLMGPDEGHGYAAELIDCSQRAGFRLAAALDDDGEHVLGFGMGFTGLAGQLWTDCLISAVDPEAADEWLIGHFEFAQFGVVPHARRRGVATAVYDVLFDGLPHDRAILTVLQSNPPARAFYDARGWTTVHREFFSPSGLGPYRLMGRRFP